MNLQEENRGGYVVSAQMKEVWNVQLELAQKLIDVCEKHNLKIWADGGTLLGAVRHKGFIPWDDDIDMLMFREDYDKLVEIAPEEFKSPYFFQSAKTEKNYPLGHAQLRMDGTAAIPQDDVFQNIHQGIPVDIFLYDSIPELSNPEFQRRLKRADYLQDILLHASMMEWCWLRPRRILKCIKSKIIVWSKGWQNIFDEYDNLFRENDYADCPYYAPPCFMRSIFRTATKMVYWYRECVWLPFEDMKMPAPIDYDKVLKTQYGEDYMTPVKKPALHIGFSVLDAHHSYKAYLSTLRRKFWLRYPIYIFKSIR